MMRRVDRLVVCMAYDARMLFFFFFFFLAFVVDLIAVPGV